MEIKKNSILDLKVEKLVFGGRGIANFKTDSGNYKVFVADAIPGDRVRVKIIRKKPAYAEAKIEEFIEKSDLNIKARCEHFSICGGCSWQNISYEDQLKFKEEQVIEAFKHIGGFENPPVRKILASQEQYFYRNKLELSFGDDETNNLNLGFHPKGMRYDVFNLNNCYLQSEKTGEIARKVVSFFREKNIKRYNFRENTGVLRNMVIKHSKTNDNFLINLSINRDVDCEWLEEFSNFIFKIDKISSFYLTTIGIKKGRKTLKEIKLIRGEKYLKEVLKIDNSDFIFRIDPESFFQPNSKQAEKLYEKVLEAIDLSGCKNNCAFDLYCGTGTIGLAISKKFKSIVGLEINDKAVLDANENANLNDIKNTKFYCGDAGKLINELNAKPDCIVVDPPRAGLSDSAINQIMELKNSALVYISCNPITLARDCRILCKNGYYLKYVQPVDMFPQTYHIEQVALLVREL